MDITINEVGLISREATLAHGFPAVYIRVYVRVTATELLRQHTMEFHIGRWVSGAEVVRNAQGWLKTATGTYIDPTTLDFSQPEPQWEYRAVTVDLRAEVLAIMRENLRNRFMANKLDMRIILKPTLTLGDRNLLPLAVRNLQGTVITQ